MIDATILRELPLFAPFSDIELEWVARKAADLRILAGDYLTREGDEAYFYVILDGTMTVTKRVAASEVVLASRGRGDFFGESPVLLGADNFANLRAETQSRVMRLDPFDLQALIVQNAAFKATILAAMSERLSEIGRRASTRRADAVVVVGQRWDVPSRNARTLLARNRIRHEFLDARNPTTAERIPDLESFGDGYRVVKLVDGRVLVRPSTRDLAIAVGLQTEPSREAYDAIVIGGPAGLAAAVYGASEGPDVTHRARIAGRSSRYVVAHRKLSRFSDRTFRRRSRHARARTSPSTRSGDSRYALCASHRSRCEDRLARRRPNPPCANDRDRDGRFVARARACGYRTPHGGGRLLRSCAQRSAQYDGERRLSHRGRK